MPVKFDVAKVDLKSYVKGDIVGIVPEGGDFSDDPDHYVGVEITDATYEQANHYIHGWQIDFVFTLVNQNTAGWRYRIEVDPAVLDASETAKHQIKDQMQTHVESNEEWEGSSVVGFTTDSMTIDIPKNGPYQSAQGMSNLEYLQFLKRDFSDIFKTVVNVRRYYFDPAKIDWMVGQGMRTIQITKAQALTNIIDRLDE